MKRVIINEDKLDIMNMDDTVIRVKALMVNKNDQLLVVHNNHTYQFPGGHWRSNESLEDSLRREIKEETGITSKIERGPFMVIEEYYDNYDDVEMPGDHFFLNTDDTTIRIVDTTIRIDERSIINDINII